MQAIYDADFTGMTLEAVPLANLESTRAATLAEMPKSLSANQREFLLSLVRAEPRWDLMPFKQLPDLPAVRWKLQNHEKLRTKNKRKFSEQYEQLEAKLSIA